LQPPSNQAPERAEETRQALQQIQAAGHGTRAVNIERVGREAGLPIPNPLLAGYFVDADMSPQYGAATNLCTTFRTFIQAPSTDPNVRCTAFRPEREAEAQFFYSDPTAPQIGGFQRDLWRAILVKDLTHELQHIKYNTSSHANPTGGTCSLTTEMYRSGPYVWHISDYLSELSAAISEFAPLYRAIPTNAPAGNPIRGYFQTWLTDKIDTGGESIGGILKAIRCSCSCSEVDQFVRDTFNFTTNSWRHQERVLFNSLLSAWPNLNWPLTGDPVCIDQCESNFQRCLPHSGWGMGGMDCLASRGTCFNFCGP
jgi:hypothetical protein